HYQNLPLVGEILFLQSAYSGTLFLGGRKIDLKSRPYAKLGVYSYKTIVSFDDRIRSSKSESGPFSFCSEIGIKDLLEKLLRYPNSIIFKRDSHILVGLKGYCIYSIRNYILGFYFYSAASGHCLLGVNYQITYYLANLSFVDIYHPEIIRY